MGSGFNRALDPPLEADNARLGWFQSLRPGDKVAAWNFWQMRWEQWTFLRLVYWHDGRTHTEWRAGAKLHAVVLEHEVFKWTPYSDWDESPHRVRPVSWMNPWWRFGASLWACLVAAVRGERL